MAGETMRRSAVVKLAVFCGAVFVVGFLFRGALTRVIALVLGSATLAFLIAPMVNVFRRRVKRNTAIVSAYLAVFVILIIGVVMLAPPIVQQSKEIISTLPDLFREWQAHLAKWGNDLELRGLPNPVAGLLSGEVVFGENAIKAITQALPNTLGFAGNIVEGASLLVLMVILSYYFLLDKDELILKLEMMIPLKWRKECVFYCVQLKRELSAFVKGQLIIAVIVGALTAFGLLLVGVRGYAVLGVIMGMCNLIPYFGPWIGSVPTLFLAFGQGGVRLFSALIVVLIVQQIDAVILAPKITGAATKMSPIVVLIAISAGGSIAGIAGMLFAIPTALFARAAYKISQRIRENN